MSDPPAGRPMKYPYTYTAKLAQFPYKLYWNNRFFRIYACSFLLMVPLYWKIHKAVNSPANIAAYEKIKAKEAEEHAEHALHRY